MESSTKRSRRKLLLAAASHGIDNSYRLTHVMSSEWRWRRGEVERKGIVMQLRSARRFFVAAIFATCAAFCVRGPSCEAAEAVRPNIVLILADDLGWTDLACLGSKVYETPNIHQLARGGMKFTQSYSACTVCSPTRAALMTGKYPARLHITDWIPGAMPDNPKLLVPDWTKYLPTDETTIAQVFKAAGYATASIGKWHLAKVGTQESYPEAFGFDLNIAGTDKPQPTTYYAPWKIPTLKPDGK